MAGSFSRAIVRATKVAAVFTGVGFIASALSTGQANTIATAHVRANLVSTVLAKEVINASADSIEAVTMARALNFRDKGGAGLLRASQTSPAFLAAAAGTIADTLVGVSVAHEGTDLLAANQTRGAVAPVAVADA